MDDDTHVSLWSTKFTKMNAIIALVTALVVLFALAWCIIAFTPMKTLIPGYPDAKTKHEAIQNAIRIDSLENVILKWDLYAENLRRVVEGEEPLKIDSVLNINTDRTLSEAKAKKLAEKDSLLRKEVASEETTASGIVLPGSAQEKPQIAEVLAVGPGTDEVKMELKVGDKVIFSKYAGTDVKYNGEEVSIMDQRDILAVVE